MFRRARAIHQSALIAILGALVVALIVIVPVAGSEPIRGSATYRPEVVGRVGVVAAGRHFAAEAGMRMLARGGNAVDAGVAATFAAAVTEISHFGLGGEVPIVLYLADRKDAVVINGQGTAPAAASADIFRAVRGIPTNGPSAGTVPAVVDALAIALAEFGTLSLADVLAPAIALADGFPWYEFLTQYLRPDVERMHPSAFRVYVPGGKIPERGSIFRQTDLAQTLRALVEAERQNAGSGRKAAIHAARDRFYRGDIGQRIAKAVRDAGGLLSDAYAAQRRKLIDPLTADNTARPGDPWKFQAASVPPARPRATVASVGVPPGPSPDTTTINVADAQGNLFSASPSSAWFAGGTFIAGDTGVPLGNRMQAFVLDEGHPNVVQGGKRPRTTLSPTVVLRDGKPFLALSSPGGDSQDQQALQVFLNIAVFDMRAQEAIEVPRFNSLHYH